MLFDIHLLLDILLVLEYHQRHIPCSLLSLHILFVTMFSCEEAIFMPFCPFEENVLLATVLEQDSDDIRIPLSSFEQLVLFARRFVFDLKSI